MSCSVNAGVMRMPTPISTTRHGTPRLLRLWAIVASSTVIAPCSQMTSMFISRASGTSVAAELLIDAHLRNLAQEDVAGVDVEHQRRAGERAHDGIGDALRQQAFPMAREVAVQIGVEHRHEALQACRCRAD